MMTKALLALLLLVASIDLAQSRRTCWVVADNSQFDSTTTHHAAFATWTSPDSKATLSFWQANQPETTKRTITAHSHTFSDQKEHRDGELFIHHVRIGDLQPETRFQFDCGCSYTTPPQSKPVEFIKTTPTYGPQDPQQVHLSFGADGRTEMTVTWSTMANVGNVVLFQEVQANEKEWIQVGAERIEFSSPHVQYTHRAYLTGLKPATKYRYFVGNFQEGAQHTSPLFTFRTMSADPQWTPRLAVYGDFGLVNSRSLPLLQKDVAAGMYDGIIHIGDFAYDLHSDNGTRGDQWLNMVQSIYATVPVMTVPGNHEAYGNFTNYHNRFTMPGTPFPGGMSSWYSFDMGPIHFVGISTEVFFFDDLIYGHVHAHQLAWLEEDLALANLNRKNVPWIVIYGHRPMYCSPNFGDDDCHQQTSLVRDGFMGWDGYELRLRKYGVDLAIWAHEHAYERLWPTYQFGNFNGSAAEPYTNYDSTVHLVAGAAGCQEDIEEWENSTMPWVAYKSSSYGYGRLSATTDQYLHWEQIDDKTGQIEDEVDLRRTQFGPFAQ